jgi:hypothetical protein
MRIIGAKVIDASDIGFGVETTLPLQVGVTVSVEGTLTREGQPVEIQGKARVIFCTAMRAGTYRLGLAFDPGVGGPAGGEAEPESEEFTDYYEVMQLSPSADPETIHRIYRLLAQRLHPDNAETGNEEAFKLLLRAYRTLGDPERRASYDVRHRSRKRLQWKIFDQYSATEGVEGEKRKRQGILSLLYTKRVRDPHQAALSLLEIEDLLACPRDHLECSLWYLRENGWVQRGDNGRYVITAKGFDQAEAAGVSVVRQDRLLTTDAPSDSPAAPAWTPEPAPNIRVS